jgi:peroxiredoxin
MRHLYYLIFIVSSFSCQENKEIDRNTTFFGGQIVNPNGNYVFLFKDNRIIDSIKIDENNRFLLQIDSLESGLYNFKHDPEYQYVFIEPGDSILIRLNTLEFDESLVFSGRGAEKNNFLIETFINSENERSLFYDLYDLNPTDFEHALDSLRTEKIVGYNKLKKNNTLSVEANELILASIDYPYYTAKEVYPFAHKNKAGKPIANELPVNFYSFRDEVDKNNKNLSHFRSYINYLTLYFNNLSYEACASDCHDTISEKPLHYNVHKLKLIDSVVHYDTIKNILLRNTAYSYLFSNHEHSNDKIFLKEFFKYSSNANHDHEIDDLYHSIQNIQKGKQLPTLYLFNTSRDSIHINLSHAKNKTTVYYFWSAERPRHLRSLRKKIPELQALNPKVDFVGININESHEDWIKAIKLYGLDRKTQFRTTNLPEMRKNLVMPKNLNTTIIVDSKGNIIDAFANIYDAAFEKELAKN